MKKEIKIQPEPRRSRILELKSFLENPGYFSILLLGDRGTGKTHWIDYLTNELNSVTVNCPFYDSTIEFWDSKFKEADNSYLIVDEVEKLDKKSQEILLQIMSTSNGKYGFSEKKYSVRVVFTSSYKVSILRDGEKYLLNTFFDRIAQLTVELPSFKESNKDIRKDFIATWKKMNFGGASNKTWNCPGIPLFKWLEKNSSILYGNFRDLDKIAINWNQIQMNDNTLDDQTILEKVVNDFTKYYHFTSHKPDDDNAFYFTKGKTKNELEKVWKTQFKQWAKKEYGSLEEAAIRLDMSKRTFEKW